MRSKLFIIPSFFIFYVAGAQTGSGTVALTQATATTPVSASSSTPVVPPEPPAPPAAPTSSQTTYLEYQSVYEAATVEEEVKMAAERFDLTPSQQEMWMTAATDRRAGEKFAEEKLNSKADNYEKSGVYRGLRSSQNTFYEIITGYLTPAQKQKVETDRLILQEKQRRLAKLPPPPPPAPTVTATPVDSAAIKKEEKPKKKSKKKKKAVAQ